NLGSRETAWTQNAGGIRNFCLNEKCSIGFIKRGTDSRNSTLMSTGGTFHRDAHRLADSDHPRLAFGDSRLQSERMHLHHSRNRCACSEILSNIRVSLSNHAADGRNQHGIRELLPRKLQLRPALCEKGLTIACLFKRVLVFRLCDLVSRPYCIQIPFFLQSF